MCVCVCEDASNREKTKTKYDIEREKKLTSLPLLLPPLLLPGVSMMLTRCDFWRPSGSTKVMGVALNEQQRSCSVYSVSVDVVVGGRGGGCGGR